MNVSTVDSCCGGTEVCGELIWTGGCEVMCASVGLHWDCVVVE